MEQYRWFKSIKSGDDRIIEIAPPLKFVLQELKLKTGGSEFVLPRSNKWNKGEQARELRKMLLGIVSPSIKVMAMGGWKDMKTMMVYSRKAGVDIKGALSGLDLHNPNAVFQGVIPLFS